MAWVRLDDGFFSHPKVLSLDVRDRWFHVCAMGWVAAHNMAGDIPSYALAPISALAQRAARYASSAASALVLAGLWEERGDGWHIHDWELYNPNSENTKSLRDKEMLRRQKWREDKRRQRSETKGVHQMSEGQSGGSPPPRAHVSRPVPSPEDGTSISRPPLGVDIEDVQAAAFGPEGAMPPGGSKNGQPEHPPAPLSDDLVQALAPASAVMAQLLERRRLADLASQQQEWREQRDLEP